MCSVCILMTDLHECRACGKLTLTDSIHTTFQARLEAGEDTMKVLQDLDSVFSSYEVCRMSIDAMSYSMVDRLALGDGLPRDLVASNVALRIMDEMVSRRLMLMWPHNTEHIRRWYAALYEHMLGDARWKNSFE